MSLRHTFAVTLFGAASLPLLALAEGSQSQHLGRIVLYGTSGNGGAIGTTTTDPIEAESISRLQAGSINDALAGNASVISGNRGNILRSLPNIRGFGGSPHMANDPAVQVTLDGVSTDGNRVYQNAGAMIVDPSLLRSVEVLTGPLASLEYGSGVSGGTVAMETINGSDLTGEQQGFKFRQQLGANSNGKGWLTSSTLAWQPSDKLDFLFNYTRRAADGQKDGAGKSLGLPGFNVPSYLLKGRLRFDEANSITLSVNKSETAERDVPYAQATGPSPVFGNVNRDIAGTIASLAYNYAPSDSDLIDLELKYSKSKQDIMITPLAGGASAGFAGRYEAETDTISLKNTASFQSGGIDHILRAGIEWSSRARDTWNTAGQAGYGYNPAGKDQRLSVFAIDNMDFNNGWRASLAARVERQKIEGSKNGGSSKYGPFENTAKTFGFGLERDLGAGFTAFGSIAKGESLATLDVFHINSISLGRRYGDDVQKNTNYELGARFTGTDVFGAGDSLSGSLSVYQTQIKDAMFGSGREGSSEYTGYKMRGIELSARYQTAGGFYAIGSLAHADHKERYYTVAAGNIWQDYLYNPGTQATVTLGHKWQNGWDVSWKIAGAKRLTVHQASSSETKGGWAVNDLSVRYSPQSGALAGMTIDFAVENVFDKTYKQPMSYLNEPGRNVKLTLAKTF